VHFVGSLPDPWQALFALDVLVVPSWAEPFGRVAAEAQRAGTPVLAARAGGLVDVVHHGQDGLLFPARDPDALAEQLQSVLIDPELRARLASAGRVSAQRFDPAIHAAAMAEVLQGTRMSRRAGAVGSASARSFVIRPRRRTGRR
jgi:D-inositol-3-phosphate glycosyltransferase